jgi:hypothetical protein
MSRGRALLLAAIALPLALGLLGWRLAAANPPRVAAPAGASVPARLTEVEVVDVVAGRPAPDGSGLTLRQALGRWSAEYRGDGSWQVNGGDAAWVLFEQSRSVLPANRAAIDLESSGAAGRAR